MISTVTYNGDGTTRIFPVAFEIKGEEYTVVYVGGVAIADRSLYDIINNSIVFNTAPVIGTNNVEIVVASTTTEIADLNAPPSTIQTVLDNMADINAIANTIIPNIDEILLADDNATTATTKALEALTSANNADTSEANALTYSNNALTSANNADASEVQALIYKNSAEASATTATTQAGIATTKAGEASTSASNALTSRNEAEGFRDEAEASALSVDSANLVHKVGDETIAGIKTFSSSPIVPTPEVGNNTTAVATTAFVNAEISGDVGVANSSLVKTALNASGSAPIYACRAWVNFNGTGTVAIRASGNVSSITDNGVGDYNVNFTVAMPDANYSYFTAAAPVSLVEQHADAGVPAASSLPILTRNNATTAYDSDFIRVCIFR